ncbi:MAG: class I SAM-dependent RNA methyltransferase [Acidimicrobiia bacterium]
MLKRGDTCRLTVERPAAGGRMIARHEGAIVFVAGAIPGEVVEAQVEKVQRGTVWASATTILEPSPDRGAAPDGASGGSVFAHVDYERQRALKSEIIADTLRRIGRITVEAPVDVMASRVDGYRMRARLHVRHGRIGFFREGSHVLCDPGPTGQLRDDTVAAVARLESALAGAPPGLIESIELSESIDASQRAIHLQLHEDAEPATLVPLVQVEGVTGATCAHGEDARTIELFGSAVITDRVLDVPLDRHVRSFFQGNRYLIAPFAEWVAGLVDAGPLVDLYAGVGLFSLTVERLRGTGPITAVEGDRFAARDLKRNASGRITVAAMPVEDYVSGAADRVVTTIVDPPRTGLSKAAMTRALAIGSPRLIYVSCDIATFARDARVLLDAGYAINSMRAFDMFPNTAHVEMVTSFSR